jgi:hypothetical protein
VQRPESVSGAVPSRATVPWPPRNGKVLKRKVPKPAERVTGGHVGGIACCSLGVGVGVCVAHSVLATTAAGRMLFIALGALVGGGAWAAVVLAHRYLSRWRAGRPGRPAPPR